MTSPERTRRPVTLQKRLVTTVIGFASLILIIIAMITSGVLTQTLEQRLQEQVLSAAQQMTQLTYRGSPTANAEDLLDGRGLQQGSSLLFALSDADGSASGVVLTRRGAVTLSDSQLRDVAAALSDGPRGTVRLGELGSFQIAVAQGDDNTAVVTGLPRDELQATRTLLLSVIALATIGGLILLAITTAVTIRVGLRPLRAIASTATRVANQPLDRGEVTIAERVPTAEADPRTETGLVGASLNTLLDHVDSSLAARQQNEERMRRFVADASHELRTPLASIRGYSELSLKALTQRPGPETVEGTTSALERIQAQSLRMTRLVEDLLLLARLDEGTELVHGTVDLTQLALEGITDARPTAPEHIWAIDVPDEPVTVLGDAGRLNQVITNLLANARTHTPAGTRITLTVTETANDAQISVADNGPGIDEKVRDELFARFARGDTSRARQTGGTGLGLAIAKAIVDGHHGTITVQSTPGSTVFSVRLPKMPPAGPVSSRTSPVQ